MHLHNCICFQEHLRMLWHSLRARCLAPGGPWSIWKYWEALVRSTGVSGRFACGFWTDLHFADGKEFTSDSWRLNYIRLHHPEDLQDGCQRNLTIHCEPRLVKPAQCRELTAYKESVYHLHVFSYLEHAENIADWESQPLPPPILRTQIYTATGSPLNDYIAEPWERHTQGCVETNLQNTR